MVVAGASGTVKFNLLGAEKLSVLFLWRFGTSIQLLRIVRFSEFF
jgi:hypothetical protein